MFYEIVIEGKIKPKERPRVTRYGRVYTPKATIDTERLIARQWQDALFPILNSAVMVEITNYRKVPTSFRKAEREKALSGTLRPHAARGDLDNIIKSILDGLNGYAYKDDKQVCCIVANDFYGSDDKCIIAVCNMEG